MSYIKQLEKFLNYSAARNNVISKNIANVGTKDYQRQDVVFKNVLSKELNSVLKADNVRHFNSNHSLGKLQQPFDVVVDKSPENLSGVNNVEIENEMATLAENTLNFKFAARKISSYYKFIRTVIKSGNG